MKLFNFISSLLPSFDKSNMMDDLEQIKKRLNELMPALESVNDNASSRKFNVDWNKGVDNDITSKVKVTPKPRGNYYAILLAVMSRVQSNIPVIERLIDQYFNHDITKEAMTLVRSNLLQYLETMSFATDLTARILLISMTMEEDYITKAEMPSYIPAELNYINTRIVDYYTALQILAGDKQDIETRIKNLPDVNISPDNIDSVSAVIGKDKMDVFGFNFIGVKLNPIYHIRMAIAEYQTANYRLMVEQKKALELKLLRLKQLDSGKEDAAVQQKINALEARISTIASQIREMEEDYA